MIYFSYILIKLFKLNICRFDQSPFAIFLLKPVCHQCKTSGISGPKTEPSDLRRPLLKSALHDYKSSTGSAVSGSPTGQGLGYKVDVSKILRQAL